MAENFEKLADELFANFEDFQHNVPGEGGSSEANKYVADELARSIQEGIDRGQRLEFKGKKNVSEINAIPAEEKNDGDIYLCGDAGTLEGENPLDVKKNTAVIWQDGSWKVFFEFDLDDYYTKGETVSVATGIASSAMAGEARERIAADNSLGERIDALDEVYETKADAKAKANAYGILMRENGTNTLQFYRPSLA